MRHGILLIDKPEGLTSHDIVARVRRILPESHVGHLGTLDPLATGLLVLFIGKKALKVIELFQGLGKTYEARITFGKVSATYDREGPIEDVPPKKGWSPPTEKQLLELLRTHFTGDHLQTPPSHSAIHIDGERAYEIIRKNPGALFSLPPRHVQIEKMQLLSYAYPVAALRIQCSSGTYIRSLAHELGELLRCGAYLENLRRTKVGQWKLEDAHSLEKFSWAHVIPLKEILASFPRLDLSEEEWQEIEHGRSIPHSLGSDPVIGWYEDLPVSILERDPKTPGKAHPKKVL